MTDLYDRNGNRIGSINDGEGNLFFLAFIFGIGFAIYHFFEPILDKVINRQSLEPPYNYIAAFYNYIIVIPIKAGIDISHWLDLQEFTKYPNLNSTITVVGVLLFIGGIVFIVRSLINILKYFGYGAKVFWLILVMPSVLGGSWFLLLKLFNWLFATV